MNFFLAFRYKYLLVMWTLELFFRRKKKLTFNVGLSILMNTILLKFVNKVVNE